MTDTGIWNEQEAEHHVMSPELLDKLIKMLDPKLPVIDMGCGRGDYVKGLRAAGFEAIGIEGSILLEHGADIYHLDLTRDDMDLHIMGHVISLEVGEHIPVEYEQVFLGHLVRNCTGVLVVSWALPGQAGIGHVNCRPHEYIIEEVEKRGMKYDIAGTLVLRDGEYNETPWFRDTLMMFRW